MRIEIQRNLDFKKFTDPELAKDAIKKSLKHAIGQMQESAMRKVKVDTGHLKRSISSEINNGEEVMQGIVGATADYAGYVEKGTRYMSAQPYLKPALNEVKPQFLADMERIAQAGGNAND